MKKLFFSLRFSLFALLLILGYIKPAAALNCVVHTSSSLVFGQINLLEGQVKTTSASLTYGCSGTPGTKVLLCLSMGSGPNSNYETRYLQSGSEKLGFNLYTDPTLSSIWGSVDSGGAPAGVPVLLSLPGYEQFTANAIVYGSISPSGQTGRPTGFYDTNYIGGWPVKISYKEYVEGTPVNCSSGFSATATTTFYIQAEITKSCRIDGTTPLSFGSVFGLLDQNRDSNSTITVSCNGTAYRVALDNGMYAQGTTRRMQGKGGYIQYDLYRDSGRSERWGNNAWYDGLANVGNGLPQALTVYGRVPVQTLPGPGAYSDTITVTVAY